MRDWNWRFIPAASASYRQVTLSQDALCDPWIAPSVERRVTIVSALPTLSGGASTPEALWGSVLDAAPSPRPAFSTSLSPGQVPLISHFPDPTRATC